MEETTGFAAFAMFHALKLHFHGSYDYVKYHGKTNVSKDTFSNRKDKYTFYKFSRKYHLDDLRNFYIANFISKEVNWIGDISGPDGEQTYKQWQSRVQRLTYMFEQDIMRMLDIVETPTEMITVKDGQHPLLLEQVMQGEVSMETLTILNDIMNFFPMWDRKISDTIIWPAWKIRSEKYLPFLEYDKKKFKTLLKERLEEHA